MKVVKIGESKKELCDGPKEDKVVFIDGDSIIHQCAHPGKDEYGNNIPDYIEDDYPIAEMKVSERIHAILNKIECRYNIIEKYICIKGSGNFRYALYPEYKANRAESLPIIEHLCKYLEENFGAIRSVNCEADDLVYTLSKKIGHEGIIAAIDKDLKQIKGIHYNYNKEEWETISEERARYNLAMQMCINDVGDNVNFTKGVGIRTAEKLISMGMTDYEYLRAIYPIYLKKWKKDAKQIITLAYNLLSLKDVTQ